MSFINGSCDHPDYQIIVWHELTSTTAVSYSVATSSSESLSNNGEKPNQPKRSLFPECDYGEISVKHEVIYAFSLALSINGIHKSTLEGWSLWENWCIL